MDASTFWGWKLLLRIGMLVFGYQFILLGYGALLGNGRFSGNMRRSCCAS
jgi:hypothetical protein